MLMSTYIVPSAFRPYGIVQAADRQCQCQCLLAKFCLRLGHTENKTKSWGQTASLSMSTCKVPSAFRPHGKEKLGTDGVIVKMSMSAYMVPCAFRPLGRWGSCRAAWRTDWRPQPTRKPPLLLIWDRLILERRTTKKKRIVFDSTNN